LPKWLFCHRRAYLFGVDVAENGRIAGNTLLAGQYSFRQANAADAALCAAVSCISVEEFHRRFQNGCLCYLILADDQPVHVTWVHFGPCYVRYFGLMTRPDPSTCYFHGIMTAPEHRGRGLYKFMLQWAAQSLRERGIKSIRQLVEVDNAVPTRTLPKLGYEVRGTVRHTTLFAIRYTAEYDGEGRKIRSHWHLGPPRGAFGI
jgi:GNAT superfamily N-acetyltransferase